jgi:hypothetical protein
MVISIPVKRALTRATAGYTSEKLFGVEFPMKEGAMSVTDRPNL